MNRALFLDLGGTLLRTEDDEIYVAPDGAVEVLPNVVDRLSNVELEVVVVVTNQSGIERGILTTERVREYIVQLNRAAGGVIDDYWACPRIISPYRKPAPGMLLSLADKHFVDLTRSVYVGDSEDDRRCAKASGVGEFRWAAEFFGWT
jgi:HAD superfamily hydrolase (TIGR01662 family)